MSGPVRRNFAHLSTAEQQEYIDAVLHADLSIFSDGVSYWDKQDQIHEGTHNHGGNSFLPWHRELVNRYEALLQAWNPDIAAHYWDWTEDPRAASDGQGGTVAILSSALLGTASGSMNGPLAALHNQGVLAGSRDQTGSFTDPPRDVTRVCRPGAPGVATDNAIITSSDALPQAQQWLNFRTALESSHNSAHGFFGVGSTIWDSHRAFEDPFVFLLHSNVDRLFAMWQTQPRQGWRLDPDQVYGDQSNTTGAESILAPLQPWDGTVEFGAPIEPWVDSSPLIEKKNCRHPSVVRPPCYDTLPITVEQVTPSPGDAVTFLDVVEHLPTARALRLRVLGCATVTANATVTAPFTMLAPAVTSPAPQGFEDHEVLVWVLFTPDAAGSTANGTLTVTIAETGDVFNVPITASVVPNPSVGTSLVLDTSGSMSMPSGLHAKDRMDVLHDAAPLFVTLLDTGDGIGVVRFDTDATAVAPVADAGPMIGGQGRLDASTAITATSTNALGLTAIGDGLEAAATQLAAVAGSYDSAATIVFTDGHETADKTIAAAASSVNSRVFAIGLGTADQLNPGALSDIANGSGGYLLLTGNPGVDDQLLLQKYFAQVLAGATNAAIVVDPRGFVPAGGKAVVPFQLTAADIRADVMVLGDLGGVFQVEILAPDGTTLSAGSGAEEVATDAFRVLRIVPADVLSPPTAEGRWEAVLSLDDKALDRWLRQLRERLSKLEDRERAEQILTRVRTGLETHGVPYTLSVQARSALHLHVDVTQSSRRPGAIGSLRAVLTDSGVPLANSANVLAEITDPDGAVSTLRLHPDETGVFRAAVPTIRPGVYRILVRASGTDLRGTPFTREELRTLAVWARGDEAPPLTITPGDGGPVSGLGDLLLCFLEASGVREALERQKIDPDHIERCIRRNFG